MSAPTKSQTGSANGNKPVIAFRAKGVKVSVWENFSTHADGERKFYKTTIQRIYKEGEEFKTTNSLSRDDLPVAQHLLHKAWEWILQAESNKNSDEQELPT